MLFRSTVIFFLLIEIVLRAAYFGRNSLVRYVPLPYVVGDDYGPIPPWLDDLLTLRPDDALIWRNIPNARRARWPAIATKISCSRAAWAA